MLKNRHFFGGESPLILGRQKALKPPLWRKIATSGDPVLPPFFARVGLH